MIRFGLLLLLTVGCYADTTTYTDFDQWQSAVLAHDGAFLLYEDFAGDRINTSGLTITATSTFGRVSPGDLTISDGVVSGCVGTTGCLHGENSIWTVLYASELYGLWFPNISVLTSSIYGLEFYPDNSAMATLRGTVQQLGGYDPILNVPFGFVTDKPFSELTIAEDVGFVDFEFTGGMVVGDPIDPRSSLATPEPAFLLPLGGLGLLALGARRRVLAKLRN